MTADEFIYMGTEVASETHVVSGMQRVNVHVHVYVHMNVCIHACMHVFHAEMYRQRERLTETQTFGEILDTSLGQICG